MIAFRAPKKKGPVATGGKVKGVVSQWDITKALDPKSKIKWITRAETAKIPPLRRDQ
jgi:hypothetical protein